MIRLFIKENKKNHHRMTVRDKNGQILYLIEGTWGRQNDIIHLSSLQGEILLKAKQTNLSPFFKFQFYQADQKAGIIRKHPGFFGLRDSFFTIQPQNWLIKGDFEQLYFEVFKDENLIMVATKIMSNANYLFSMKVKKDEDLALASLVTILLDHYSRDRSTDKSYNEVKKDEFNLGLLNYKSYPYFYYNQEKTLKKNR